MEDTQLVDWEAQEEEPEDSNGSPPQFGLEPVGRLHLFSSVRGPEKDFLLYPGENVVGRIPGCSVALPFPSISKHHAIIEISAQGRAPILRDCGSLNHTRLLRPPKKSEPWRSLIGRGTLLICPKGGNKLECGVLLMVGVVVVVAVGGVKLR
uniref:FHA domain-containing protein n=1 Tax=Monodelphis domestica TaxID=13616 RepID=A0A5F8H0I8_MONDO